MRALLLSSYRHLEIADMPPPVPGPDDVLVRVAACGICGSASSTRFQSSQVTSNAGLRTLQTTCAAVFSLLKRSRAACCRDGMDALLVDGGISIGAVKAMLEPG
jgi:hypothetical protein